MLSGTYQFRMTQYDDRVLYINYTTNGCIVCIQQRLQLGSLGWADPPSKKYFCHNGENVLDITFIRMMRYVYLK